VISLIKIEQLRYLVELEKTHSFHKCAENLYLSQPAISLSIRNLEKELGTNLFERTTSGVYPTEIGQTVVQQAKIVLENIDLLYQLCQKNVSDRKQFNPEALNISTSLSFSSVVMPNLLTFLHKEFPETTLSLHTHTLETFPSFIVDNPYNIGFYYIWSDDYESILQKYPNINATRLFKINFQLAISKTAPFEAIDKIDLSQTTFYQKALPYITYTESTYVTKFVQQELFKKNIIQPILQTPVTRLFNTYITQGLAAGIILKLGINTYLSTIEKKQLNFIPIQTEKECILYLFFNRNLPEPVYQIILQYLQICFSQM